MLREFGLRRTKAGADVAAAPEGEGLRPSPSWGALTARPRPGPDEARMRPMAVATTAPARSAAQSIRVSQVMISGMGSAGTDEGEDRHDNDDEADATDDIAHAGSLLRECLARNVRVRHWLPGATGVFSHARGLRRRCGLNRTRQIPLLPRSACVPRRRRWRGRCRRASRVRCFS
jgi:hypothetical protein